MIRILHTIDTTGPGGAETVFTNLATGLDSNKYESFAAIRGPGWVCDTLRKQGLEPIFINSRGGFNVRYLTELIRIIRNNKIDLIQSHLFGSNLYSSLAGIICSVPVISVFHGFVDAKVGERLMTLKTRLINRGSRKIVFVSDRLREYYVKKLGFSVAKAATIFNGVDTSVFYPCRDDSIRRELGLSSNNILIGAVGNVRPAKGYDLFLKAACQVYKQYTESRFVIVGQAKGPLYESLLRLRKDLGMDEVFHFIGFRKESAKIFNNLDLFILPSRSEGFSLSIIEAMACGVPVLATKSGGPEDIIDNTINGILVDGTENELAKAICACLINTKTNNDIVKRAYQKIHNRYNTSLMFKFYEDMYKDIMKTSYHYNVT